MKLSKYAQTETVLQNVEQIKTRITDTVNNLNTTMQQVQDGVRQMQDLMRDVEQLDVQVRSLQQAQAKQQEAMQQAQQVTQQADDEDNAIDWKLMLGKAWKGIEDLLGPDKDKPYEEDVDNSVAGVRGSREEDLFTRTAKGKKKKSKHSLEPMPDHPTPRDGEHNKDLPDFWRKNYDYGESPYMHIDEIEKITDKPPLAKKKRVKKKK